MNLYKYQYKKKIEPVQTSYTAHVKLCSATWRILFHELQFDGPL